MSYWRKIPASPFVLCVLLVSALIVPGSTFAIEPAHQAAGERVELQVASPASWIAWLIDWMTGEVQTSLEAATVESCLDPECSPPDSETTGSSEPTGEGTNPTTEGGPGLDIGG